MCMMRNAFAYRSGALGMQIARLSPQGAGAG
jgi:hypothetical protein